jgi:hypothetical protein
MFTVCFACLTGCANGVNDEEEILPTPLKIYANIDNGNTRGDKTSFNVGDIITVSCGDEAKEYKYTGSISRWEPADGSEGLLITNVTETYEATYSDADGDDLYASTTVSALDPTAIFSFKHVKAKMLIKLSASGESVALSGAKYSISGLETRYEAQQEIPENGEITVYVTTDTTEFQLDITTADGQLHRATINGLSLTAGHSYICNVTIG